MIEISEDWFKVVPIKKAVRPLSFTAYPVRIKKTGLIKTTKSSSGMIAPMLLLKLADWTVAISTPSVRKNKAPPNDFSGPTLSSISSLYGRLPTEIPAKKAPASGDMPMYPQMAAIPMQYPSALTKRSSEERSK